MFNANNNEFSILIMHVGKELKKQFFSISSLSSHDQFLRTHGNKVQSRDFPINVY